MGEEEEAAQGVQRFSFVQLSMDPSAYRDVVDLALVQVLKEDK